MSADERHDYRDLHLERPHSARIYDFLLGGKDNYAADREVALKSLAVAPNGFVAARENRAFMHRATRVLAERGIRQWLDIGTGIPTQPNLHEVAQRVAPEARVVYVDNDPLVLAHAHALMASAPEGRTAYVEADVREIESVLKAPELARTLDLSQPVVLSLSGLMHYVLDEADPFGIVARLLDALPSGSALALSHLTADFDAETMTKVSEMGSASGVPLILRPKAEVERFFAGLTLLEPGLVACHRWRPDPVDARFQRIGTPTVSDAEVSNWGGVGLKP